MKTSIVVPVFNTEPQYLRTAIESLISQTHTDWELVLVDDFTTKEETIKFISKIGGMCP